MAERSALEDLAEGSVKAGVSIGSYVSTDLASDTGDVARGSRTRHRPAADRSCARSQGLANPLADPSGPRSQARPALRLPRLAIHSRRVSARTGCPGV